MKMIGEGFGGGAVAPNNTMTKDGYGGGFPAKDGFGKI